MKTIGIVNGPNLERLGKREPEIYGSTTLAQLEEDLRRQAERLGVRVLFFHSNSEGEIVDFIYRLADEKADALIMNPGGLTHTSVVLRDALAGAGLPYVEVHISNIYRREEFRRHSLTAAAAKGLIAGLGVEGYALALDYLAARA